MEETLRRITRGPHPSDVVGLLSSSEAETAKAAVADRRGRDRDRFDAARRSFESICGRTRSIILSVQRCGAFDDEMKAPMGGDGLETHDLAGKEEDSAFVENG